MRSQELMPLVTPSHPAPTGDAEHSVGQRQLATYATLAEQGKHVLSDVLGKEQPHPWHHYPENDAIDQDGGYQWFYHSHSPEDRPNSTEHGHFHLFVRKSRRDRYQDLAKERAFRALTGKSTARLGTRHLLAIGLNAKGIPTRLFTVNSWVTGDLMLSAATTRTLMEEMRLRTGHEVIDAVIESVISLCRNEIEHLLAERDRVLLARNSADVLTDQGLEILSEEAIDLDAILQRSRMI